MNDFENVFVDLAFVGDENVLLRLGMAFWF
jgi:hypothetical protein